MYTYGAMKAKPPINKTKLKHIRFTEDELRMLNELAAAAHLNGSAWVRSHVVAEHRKLQKGKR